MAEKGKPAEIAGVSVGGKGIAQGPAVFISAKADYSKNVAGKIIVSDSFSPNLALLYKNAKGVVSKSGGQLAHSAIIAREMDLPAIVQVQNFELIAEGQMLRIDGKTGKITIAQ